VPKAAVNKNYLSSPREDEIGATRQIIAVKTEAKAHSMHHAPDDQFGLAALAFDA
jgi:hypothetical protein